MAEAVCRPRIVCRCLLALRGSEPYGADEVCNRHKTCYLLCYISCPKDYVMLYNILF